jgi:DNA-binding CsgD family transcriptional regulator
LEVVAVRSPSVATTFVGREPELSTLRERLEEACAGRGGVVTLVGEPGVGKTRTAHELAETARGRGALVLWGSCYEGDWTRSYGPWAEALAANVGAADRGLLTRELGEEASVLAQVVPEIRAYLPDLPEAPALELAEERHRLYDAFVRFLLGAREPLVLVLDDLHWADDASLRLLEYVARFVAGGRVLVVGTHRDVEPELGSSLKKCLAELSRGRLLTSVPLRNLTLEQSAELVGRLSGSPASPGAVASVFGETGGNPFFIEEVVRHLQEEGVDLTSATSRGLVSGIPETVRHTLSSRFSRLSPDTHRLLAVVAAFTGAFDFAVMQALTEMPEARLLASVDEALGARMIRARSDRLESYEFAHALVKHTLYDELSPSRKARLHRRIARALEQLHAGHHAGSAAELAYQYHRSASLPGAAHGIPYALAAAEAAKTANAPEQAASFLRMARDLAAESERSLVAEILCRLAVTEAQALMLDDATRTTEEALAALAASAAPTHTRAEFLGEIAWALKEGGGRQEIIAPLVERGLGLARDRDLAWARLELALYPVEPVSAGVINAGRWLGFDPQAVEIARASGDELEYARTVELMDWRPRQETEALLLLSRRWNLPRARIHVLSVVARELLYCHGVFREAGDVCRELLELSRRSGSLPGQGYALVHLAVAELSLGKLASAQETLGQATEVIALLGEGHRLHMILRWTEHLLAQYVEDDSHDVAAFYTGRAADPWFQWMWTALLHSGMAVFAHARGKNRREAKRLLEALTPVLERLEPTTLNHNGAVSLSAAAVWELREERFAERFRRLALDVIAAGVGDYPTTSNELTVARMSSLLGDSSEADEHFARARAVLEASGQRPVRAIVDHDEAVASGRTELAASAVLEFEVRGMSGWEDRARALGSGRPSGLTRREVEILRLLAGGRTNNEIAAELVVSVHTVERHLANIYRKIDARNRADATAYALRHEL